MSCHTWFFRPMTDDEFENMKANAYQNAFEIGEKYKNSEYFREDYFDCHLSEVKRSIEENVPCISGEFYWFQLAYGWRDPRLVEYIDGKMYVEADGYFDTARCIKTYPKKKIYSYKQYKKYVGKKWYTDVADCDKKLLHDFFKKYPKGVICFG